MPLKKNKIEKYFNHPVTVRVFDEIDSTNNEAKRRAQEDRGGAVLYVTDFQTAGRGRRGHDFYSPKGSGLYFTLSLPLAASPADIQMVTCAAAVAVCEGIESLSENTPQIKWVNDILIGGKKVAGILAELVLDDQNRPLSVIIGIGINLTTDHFPAEFAAKAGSVGKLDPNRLCAEISDRLIGMYHQLEKERHPIVGAGLDLPVHEATADQPFSGSYYSMIEKYKRLNNCLGKVIQYTDQDTVHTAKAIDIAPDGSLIVEENGTRRSLHSGEISVQLS